MHKYAHAARWDAWDPSVNYNPFAMRHWSPRHMLVTTSNDTDDPHSNLDSPLGFRDEEEPALHPAQLEVEKEPVKLDPDAQLAHVPDAQPAHFSDAQSALVPDAQPAHVPDAQSVHVPDVQSTYVASSHKHLLRRIFGTRGKGKAKQKFAEIGLAFITAGPSLLNPLAHQRSIVLVEYGSRNPLALGK